VSPKSKRELARQHLETARADLAGAERLHAVGVTSADPGGLLRDLNQGRKDYWYDGEDPDPDELQSHLVAVERLVLDAEALR
jgi:hypothetical protein